MAHSLDPMFRPRSIAVIGASRQRGTISGEIFHNLVAHGFTGPVYPVNPAAMSVQSVRAYPTIADVPEVPDLAVIVVPRRFVLDVVDQCAERGVKALIVISAGFAETGARGKALQDELLRRVRERGIRLLGPNCLGLLNTDPDVCMNATFAPTWPPAGAVAIASQSGAVGLVLLDYASQLGIGVSAFASMGNKAELSSNDLLEYWEADPRTRVILLYLESFGNPRRFMEIARRVTRSKPVVVVKAGRTEAGARAASSHTGALAGMDIAVDALLGQAGVVRTDTMEELFDLATVLANQPVPAGPRVAVLTNGGGPGIMASDACESRGLVLPPLSAHTTAALREFLKPEASIANPVDMLAAASADDYERALRLLLADDAIDSVLALFVPPIVTQATDIAEAILRAGTGSSKPILTCLIGTFGVPEAAATLRAAGFPVFSFPKPAALALSRAVRYGQLRARPAGSVPELPDIDPERARAVVAQHPDGWLPPAAVREVLAAYGIASPRTVFPRSADEAARAAAGLGFPVAVKLVSRQIVHKSDVGGVQLDLRSPEAVLRAVADIEGRLRERGLAEAFEGVVVQEMITGGVETYVGMTQAAGFGALVAFGIGGVNIEVWRDIAFRVHPLTDVDAAEMIRQIRGRPLLEGFRGSPAVDADALAEVILRVDRMVGDLPEIQELDINPLQAFPPGRAPVAVDARIRVGGSRP